MLVDIKGSIYVIELTVPYETNCKKAKRRKKERYRHIRFELISPCYAFTAITLEVTTLGFVSKDIHKFCRLLRTLEINDERIIKKKCMEVALRATFPFTAEETNPGIIQIY